MRYIAVTFEQFCARYHLAAYKQIKADDCGVILLGLRYFIVCRS
jgi:hypothetical protein